VRAPPCVVSLALARFAEAPWAGRDAQFRASPPPPPRPRAHVLTLPAILCLHPPRAYLGVSHPALWMRIFARPPLFSCPHWPHTRAAHVVCMQSALDADVAMTAFHGKWKNVKAEGMEELLVAFGVGWMKRTAASSIGYYVGSAIDEITKNGDGSMTVKSTGGSSNRTTTFKFGDTVETDGPDGNHYAAKTSLENGVWHLTNQKVHVTRSVSGNKLLMTITVGGATAKRYFEKM